MVKTLSVLASSCPPLLTAPPPPADGDSVHELVLDILNFELAPFLATWHPRLRAFEEAHPDEDESAWPDNAEFRQALRELQRHLRPYVVGLGTAQRDHPDAASRRRCFFFQIGSPWT